jgi:hypothetical protein
MRPLRPVALAVMLVAVAGCSVGTKAIDPRSLSVNRHPGPPIQVIGTVPGNFAVEELIATYRTNSSLPFCNGIGLPEPGPSPLRTEPRIKTVRRGNQVSAAVQPDRFSTGLCGWKLWGIDAVLRDPGRDRTRVAIARVYAVFERAEYPTIWPHPVTTSTCGYRTTDFSCSDGKVGDASYLPVDLNESPRQVTFAIRDSGYPAPAGYRAPCRDENDVPVYPCPKSRS